MGIDFLANPLSNFESWRFLLWLLFIEKRYISPSDIDWFNGTFGSLIAMHDVVSSPFLCH